MCSLEERRDHVVKLEVYSTRGMKCGDGVYRVGWVYGVGWMYRVGWVYRIGWMYRVGRGCIG